jgi:hypothetical protein
VCVFFSFVVLCCTFVVLRIEGIRILSLLCFLGMMLIILLYYFVDQYNNLSVAVLCFGCAESCLVILL